RRRRSAAARGGRRAVRDRARSGDERAVPRVRRRDGSSSALLLAGRFDPSRAGGRPGHVRVVARRGGVLRMGRRPPAGGGRAAGGDGRLWPWGDLPPTPEQAAFERGIGGPVPVGIRNAGAARCGALDLAGNVAEWVSSAYRPYPYDPADGREEAGAGEPRVVRGGSYVEGAGGIRSSARRPLLPGAKDTYVGFRIAADAEAGAAAGVRLQPHPGV